MSFSKFALSALLCFTALSAASVGTLASGKPTVASVSTTRLIARDTFHEITLNGSNLVNPVTTGFNLDDQVQIYARWFKEWTPTSPRTDWRRSRISGWSGPSLLKTVVPEELQQDAGYIEIKVVVQTLGESDPFPIQVTAAPVEGPRFKADPVLTLPQAVPAVSGGNMLVTIAATGMTQQARLTISNQGDAPYAAIAAYRDSGTYYFPSVLLNARGAIPVWLTTEYAKSPMGTVLVLGAPHRVAQSNDVLKLQETDAAGVPVSFDFDEFTFPTQVQMSVGGGAFKPVDFKRASSSRILIQATPALFAGATAAAPVRFSFANISGSAPGAMTVEILTAMHPLPVPHPIPPVVGPMPVPLPVPRPTLNPIPVPAHPGPVGPH